MRMLSHLISLWMIGVSYLWRYASPSSTSLHHFLMTLSFGLPIFFRYSLRLPPVIISVIKWIYSVSFEIQALINVIIFEWWICFSKLISDFILGRSDLGSRPIDMILQAISLPVSWSTPLYTVLYAPLPISSSNLLNRPFGDSCTNSWYFSSCSLSPDSSSSSKSSVSFYYSVIFY